MPVSTLPVHDSVKYHMALNPQCMAYSVGNGDVPCIFSPPEIERLSALALHEQ